MKKQVTLLMAAAFLVCSLTACKKQDKMESKSGFYFDTVISIQIEHPHAEALLEEAFSLCADYEKIFSRTKEESELYQINHRTSNQIEVSSDLASLFQEGKHYYALTDGKFDISVAPLSDLWDFKNENPMIPSADALKLAVEKVDLSTVHLDESILSFEQTDTMLDFGGLAKGYIADCLKDYLIKNGVKKGLINLGGNVLTIGTKEGGSGWNVGIQKPFAARNEILASVEAKDASVVSSGIYERYFEKDGEIYHHVLDPSTGQPIHSGLSQVTIISPTSTMGDGLSTSCLILGLDAAKELISKIPDTEAVFVTLDGKVITTDGVTLLEEGKSQ